ncbi:MAG TPA: zinc ABC transporter substrate-binding protein [Acidimicrobiia bacterium]
MRIVLRTAYTSGVGVVVLAALAVAGCGAASGPATHGKVSVVAAFYPVAYAAQRVGGARAVVTNLTPAGAEPHDLELSPKQVDEIQSANVVLVMGNGFQPAVERSAHQRDGETVVLLQQLPIGAKGKQVKEGDPNALDPHVWLAPRLMVDIVDDVARALAKADPKEKATFTRNARAFDSQLRALDMRYSQGLAHCRRTLIVTSHEAFGYLAKAYGLHQQGVSGLSPDAEPDAKRLAELSDLAKKQHVTTIFTETLVSPKIAETLAREAGGLRTDVLDPLEGLTGKEAAAGDDYLTVMNRNLEKLRGALDCR